MIQPIVEGYGEVAAVPVLLRRLLVEAGTADINVGKPIRHPRSRLVEEQAFRRACQLASRQVGCRAILVILDGDDDCPIEIVGQMEGWAQAEVGHIPTHVVLAHREFEAWFLATLESLRGRRGIRQDAVNHPNPELPRDAKGTLEGFMELDRAYGPAMDQPALTALFDMPTAYRRSRSFRRMTSAFGRILAHMNARPEVWPPAPWIA